MPRPVWPLRLFNASLFYVAGGMALAVLCAGVYAESQRAAERLVALRQGSPAMVDIQSFDPGRDTGLVGEIVIRAQVDVARPLQVFFRQGTTLRRALAFPLMAVDAARASGLAPVLGFFHIDSDVPGAEILDPAAMMPAFDTVGAYGPIVTLNGELNAPDALGHAVGALLQQSAQPVAGSLWGITPYPEGRAVALSTPRPWSGRLFWLVLGMGLLAAGLATSRLQPILAERRRLEQIARSGRKRGTDSPAMETQKARARLGLLAPAPEVRQPQGRLAGWLTRISRRAEAFRNPG